MTAKMTSSFLAIVLTLGSGINPELAAGRFAPATGQPATTRFAEQAMEPYSRLFHNPLCSAHSNFEVRSQVGLVLYGFRPQLNDPRDTQIFAALVHLESVM